jgi:hypothetical protein
LDATEFHSLPAQAVDLISGRGQELREPLTLQPYQMVWLAV